MNKKNKHLILDDRLVIQCGIQAGESFRAIALKLNKGSTAIANKIKRHLKTHRARPYGRIHNSYTYRHSCELYEICSSCRYKKPLLHCHRCNYCNREDFNLTGSEVDRICVLMSKRIIKGQSPYAILAHIKNQISCSISTVYRLIGGNQL